MKEGYLQIKIRELNEEVEVLNKRIEQCKYETEKIEQYNKKVSDDIIKILAPILPYHKFVNCCEDFIQKTIFDKLTENINEFRKLVLCRIEESCKVHSEYHKEDLKKGLDVINVMFEKRFIELFNVPSQK